jgi:hypothetical protein
MESKNVNVLQAKKMHEEIVEFYCIHHNTI